MWYFFSTSKTFFLTNGCLVGGVSYHYINLFHFPSSSAQKELWWEKLRELIAIERSHSPAGASINITYFDNATNFEHVSKDFK